MTFKFQNLAIVLHRLHFTVLYTNLYWNEI